MRLPLMTAGFAALAMPLALAQTTTDFSGLRKKLKDWTIEKTTQGHAAEGVVAKGATAAHEFAVDPNTDTIVVAVCEDAVCSDVNVVGSDSAGAFVTPDRTSGSQGIVTLFADSIASKKLKVEVSAPGCKVEACAYALSVSSRHRAYPAE
jgi:hypothetical protein